MKVGYCRTSTAEQAAGFGAQQRDLKAAGCEKLFCEQVSSLATERPKLEQLIEFVREGDVVLVTKLDRLARSIGDLLQIVARIRHKGASIEIGGLGLINGDDPVSTLLMNVLGSIAQFEREIMLARQREGIVKAKAEGKYKGRVPTARRQAPEVQRLAAAGITKTEIAQRLGISLRSVFVILAEARQ